MPGRIPGESLSGKHSVLESKIYQRILKEFCFQSALTFWNLYYDFIDRCDSQESSQLNSRRRKLLPPLPTATSKKLGYGKRIKKELIAKTIMSLTSHPIMYAEPNCQNCIFMLSSVRTGHNPFSMNKGERAKGPENVGYLPVSI